MKKRNKQANKKTSPETDARQRVAWTLPKTRRRLPSVCLPVLSRKWLAEVAQGNFHVARLSAFSFFFLEIPQQIRGGSEGRRV